MLQDRFSDILFVQPMVPSTEPDIVTSYRGSYSFHGLVVDAAENLLRRKSEHYVFVQDDVLLNPKINEKNVADTLMLSGGGAFLPGFGALTGDIQHWHWTASVIWRLFYPMNAYTGSGVENVCQYLPDPNLIREQLFRKYGFSAGPITYDRDGPLLGHSTVQDYDSRMKLNRAILDGLFETAPHKNEVTLPYPFCFGLSDFFAVDRATFERLVPVLGVLAAAQVFPEVAIPTALTTVAERVTRSEDIGLFPDWVWSDQRDEIDIGSTIDKFHRDLLLLHPVKLSKNMTSAQKIVRSFEV